MGTAESLVEHLFRHQAGRSAARLTRVLGPAYVALAEESVQEALVRALQTWPYGGVPDNPAAWLTTTARARAIDRLRRARVGAQKYALLGEQTTPDEGAFAMLTLGSDSTLADDLLRLIGDDFTVELHALEPRVDPPPDTPHIADVVLRARRH